MHTRTSRSWSAAVRDLLAGGGVAAALALAAACVPVAVLPGVLPPVPDLALGDTLTEPVVVRSVPQQVPGGVRNILDATVEVVYAQLDVPRGDGTTGPQWLRSYRIVSAKLTPYSQRDSLIDVTAFPGPTFEVWPGDSVRIQLVNSLPAGEPNDRCVNYAAASDTVPVAYRDTMQGCFHGPNWTNIHYHGFHVTPDSTGDDVLLQIAPGTTYQYAFGIPSNQSPGTHWYHPHKHGSVAQQVINGMSGAFIVRGGGLDALAEGLGMRERLIAIQTVDSALNLVHDSPRPLPVLVNGSYRPRIQMYQGEVQRWRIVNENINRTAQFQIGFVRADPTQPAPSLYEVARDGVQYSPRNYVREPDVAVLMAPGNRLDAFVQAPMEPGIYHLHAERVAAPHPLRQPRLEARRLGGTVAPADTLFTVEVLAGTPPVSTLPVSLPDLPDFLANLPGPIRSDSLLADTARMPVVVFLDENFGNQTASRPTQFYLGTVADPRMRFNDTVVYIPATSRDSARPMLLGDVQTWRVENYGISTNHPFHIHINPFQVLYVHAPNPRDPNRELYARLQAAAQDRRSPIWLDVVPLPLPRQDSAGAVVDPGYVIIRQQYADFTGQYVMHCHILGHEERGMMQLLEVFATPEEVSRRAAPRGHGHHHHH
jgi:FtsP/CotA-like multicopper oxidase with cupredoxin domain